MFLTMSRPVTKALFSNLQIFRGFDMEKDDITLQLGQRWANALRKRFGKKNTAKEIARCFNIELRTARSWLYGTAPYLKYIWIAGQKLGSGFVADLLTPNKKWKTYTNIDEALENLEKEICRLRNEIQSLKQGDDNL